MRLAGVRPVLHPVPGAVGLQRLLVSVRGPNEAVAAAKGGAHIADVEYPASALGAACEPLSGDGRFGLVRSEVVRELASTLNRRKA